MPRFLGRGLLGRLGGFARHYVPIRVPLPHRVVHIYRTHRHRRPRRGAQPLHDLLVELRGDVAYRLLGG